MSLHKPAAFRGTSPKASSSPPSLSDTHDELILSVYTSTTISDPQTQLLRRWERLSKQISRARLSCDAVITLNRSLDLAEEIVLHRAAMDENWKRVETAEGSETPMLVSSGMNAGTIGEPMASLPNAPECRAERLRKWDTKEYEHVLDGVKKVRKQFRKRQQECQVSVVTLHRTEGLQR